MPRRLAFAACSLAVTTLPAHADVFGHVELASDRVERGVSQSDHQGSLSVGLGYAHRSGVQISLAATTVSDTQFEGSAGYKLEPELAWNGDFASDWHAGIALRGQIFPGAHGSWYGNLPPRVQARTVQAQSSNYGTAEFGLSLGWKWFTLSWTRSLTDYLGASAVETDGTGSAARQTLLESTGTQYIALDAVWPVTGTLKLSAGVGRLHVPNFDTLGYTDWRLGATLDYVGLRCGLQASGSNASAETYRNARRSDDKSSATTTVTASVGWHF